MSDKERRGHVGVLTYVVELLQSALLGLRDPKEYHHESDDVEGPVVERNVSTLTPISTKLKSGNVREESYSTSGRECRSHPREDDGQDTGPE